jgi:hypothetical protein
MIKLIDILRESKQVGMLYHFTNSSFLNSIKEKGIKFEPDNSGLYSNQFYIATTRDKSGKGLFKHLGYKDLNIRITLDGNKISERYKIEPINVENIWNKDEFEEEGTPIISKFTEFFEERILSNREGYLNPKYFINIDNV